eukprot:TRINITY_DN4424_c0_g5_i1.p1 TRINITY_DN4424_c0_g5~~TRINITY_DN4424_c0_g5_i1.p1  ORF type:complete len:340 (+),score=63.55 TRINITY_DN4424_c0_g5_i1:126-1145(+)
MAESAQPRWKAFAEGGIAAMTAGGLTHPLDLIKVRMQLQGEAATMAGQVARLQPISQTLTLQGVGSISLAGMHVPATAAALQPSQNLRGPLAMGLHVARTEGARALLSGVSASLLRQGVYSSTRLGIYDILKSTWQEPGGKQMGFHKMVAAGLIAGAIGSAIGNPADVAMVRMQADGRLPLADRRNYRGVSDAISRIVRKEGVYALWKGCGPTVGRAMVVTAAQVASYDSAKEMLLSTRIIGSEDGIHIHMTASFLAGLAAAAAANPIDVIKTRMMNMKSEAGRPAPYSGAVDCALKMVRTEGALSLYRGLSATLTRQGPFTMLLFISLEQIKLLMAAL